MGRSKIKIAILTSSRADFGIYLPLARKLNADEAFDLDVIAFGTHPSHQYGFSMQQIQDEGFNIAFSFDTAPRSDAPEDISKSMSIVISLMAEVWAHKHYDIVFALGDRYEMFAAVASALPFNISIAHIHGGEITLGAIDNAFRHSITHMSRWHFTSTALYLKKVVELTGNSEGAFNTGALSIDQLKNLKFLDLNELRDKTGIDFSTPTLLITLHPETIGFEQNRQNIEIFTGALSQLDDLQQVITMPNADTSGLIIRDSLITYAKVYPKVKIVENLGSLAYLSAMKHCSLILGNSSSGFVEAGFFPKWVINIGHRQDGRIRTPNIMDVTFNEAAIVQTVRKALINPVPLFDSIYGNGNAAEKIINILKNEFANPC